MQSEVVFGIISADGIRLLEEDPFIEGAQIPLKTGESLYMYRNRDELAVATQRLSSVGMNNHYPYWIIGLWGAIAGATGIQLILTIF